MTGRHIPGDFPVSSAGERLFSAGSAQALDAQAPSWGLDPFALVEAAGRGCARILTEAYPGLFSASSPKIAAAVGSGNNGADAMVMLRALILDGHVSPAAAAVVINRMPGAEDRSPRSSALRALDKMGVSVYPWQGTIPKNDTSGIDQRAVLARADIIIDGIAGTGLQGPLSGVAGEMAAWIGECKKKAETGGSGVGKPRIVSIDIPSGNFDLFEPSMPIITADLTLAIDPKKLCLYSPGARVFAGIIRSVEGIFPPGLMQAFEGPELLTWNQVRHRVPPIGPDAYKYERGVAEIHAGSPGSAGAARIAARGAQAAGAGIVRLLVDEALYPILAVSAGGIMVAPVKAGEGADAPEENRFSPDAILLGPGWGRTPERLPVLRGALDREAAGFPLILDADAIALSRDLTFHGNTILTPHLGEFAAFTGLPKEKILSAAVPVIADTARKIRAVILFKSHVLIIAGEDGRVGIVDGMAPVLAAGGSGDLLAGFCLAIAARMKRGGYYDGYTCAAAAAALLAEIGRAPDKAHRFVDPLDLAERAASLAGRAWL
ncbi:bifunctional ADP-dependent NAD(P)H-hydrate dehydratase/NAD(P)H-hydrate epimerase [Treponema sp. TIM-1]|uniref:NAD(P)H-hydrate epimerase n=1 Tax=Treponema sp. TIM-1 TaxID=2898417 RepID=UPI00397FCAD3